MATRTTGLAGVQAPWSEAQRQAFDDAIARFETAWHSANNGTAAPTIEEFLSTADPSLDAALRSVLVRELVAIDREFRQDRGRDLPDSDYLQRFPEIGDQLWDLSTVARPESLETRTEATDAYDTLGSMQITAVYAHAVRHASGGLGEILVADDIRLGRRVAIKRLQSRHRLNPRAQRDFAQEVALTSRLEHPGIVPVHGMGQTADGAQCYIMRYVEGRTLAQAIRDLHADKHTEISLHDVAFRGLLVNFVAICNTIAYAHSQGVLHLDLKPENIMLGPFGETLVLDWGLARVRTNETSTSILAAKQLDRTNAGERGTDVVAGREAAGTTSPRDIAGTSASIPTVEGELIGTPAYASPEQAAGRRQQLGTTTDVFGLGAILYTLITNRPPYRADSAHTCAEKAMRADFTPPRQLNRRLPKELDAICCRALAAEPSARYATAQELAREIEQWLADEPIVALRPTLRDRWRHLARRHRGLVATLAVLALTIPVAVASASWLVLRERSASELARQSAEIRGNATQQIADYLTATFESADPLPRHAAGFVGRESRSSDAAMRRMLASGSRLIHEHLAEQPDLRARLLVKIGNSYLGLGDYEQAKTAIEESYQIRQSRYGDDAAPTLESLHYLARLAQDRGDYAQSIDIFRRVIAGRQKLAPPNPLALAETKYELGWVLFYQPLGLDMPANDQTNVSESLRLFTEVLETREALLPPNDRAIGNALAAVAAAMYCVPYENATAAVYLERANAVLSQADGENEFGGLMVTYLKAESLRREKRFDEADEIYRRLLEHGRATLGPHHPAVVIHLWNMAGLYRQMNDPQNAERTLTDIRTSLALLPRLRSTPLCVDGLIQYGEALRLIDSQKSREVLLEARQYAREQPQINEKSLATLARLLPDETLP